MTGKRVTTEIFIERAIALNGTDKYDYSLVDYIVSSKKVKIICKKHNTVFEQTPTNHLHGQDCPLCWAERRGQSQLSNTADFIDKAKIVHQDGNYSYSLVDYKKGSEKVIITCSKHGPFQQTPHDHLAGKGCKECSKESFSEKIRYTTDIFTTKALSTHPKRGYDYSGVDYKSSNLPVEIICSTHGSFWQRPVHHLLGCICPLCANKENGDRQRGMVRGFSGERRTTDAYISLAREIHGDKYSYALTEYSDSYTKIKVVCPEHGEFTPTPGNHLKGSGCPSCASYGFDKNVDAVVYAVKVDGIFSFTGYGITKDIHKRRIDHTRVLKESGCLLEHMWVSPFISGHKAHELETLLKQTFPLAACSRDIPGFKTESTPADYATVVAFVEDYITKNKQETTWQ